MYVSIGVLFLYVCVYVCIRVWVRMQVCMYYKYKNAYIFRKRKSLQTGTLNITLN